MCASVSTSMLILYTDVCENAIKAIKANKESENYVYLFTYFANFHHLVCNHYSLNFFFLQRHNLAYTWY